MKAFVIALLAVLVAGTAGIAVLVWSGVYNVAADEPHSRVVHDLLEVGRERSVAVRAVKLEVPDLADAELLQRGAGNYAAMCEICHLRPGLADSELRRGLYPQPPALADARADSDAARDFWIVKHGLKATGMPAWGRSMDDDTIWGMVAFLGWLPGRDEGEYLAAVAASSGHSHGGADEPMHEMESNQTHEHDSGHDDHDH